MFGKDILIFMFKHLNTSFWMNFTSNPSLQNVFYLFDLEMPPKGVKTCICESLNSGSFNSGRKKRSPQTYVNYGTGGSGSTNHNYGLTYNNWGSGGAGSRNFLNSIKYRYL